MSTDTLLPVFTWNPEETLTLYFTFIPISYFFYFQDPCAAVQWSTNTKIATSVSAMSSTPSPRPTAETRPNQSKKTQHGGQTLDLSPHDLKKYLSQPVRSIFHEQAKSIVAIQVRKSCLKKRTNFKGRKANWY